MNAERDAMTIVAERVAEIERRQRLLREQFPDIVAVAQRFKDVFGAIIVRRVRRRA